MPLPPFLQSNLAPDPIARGLQAGIATGGTLEALRQRRQVAQQQAQLAPLQQQMMQQKLQQARQMAPLQQQLMQAQALRVAQQTRLGGVPMTGDVGQRMAIEQLQKAGAKPEIIQDMLDRYHASTQRLQQMARYYGLPAIGKAQQYESQLKQTFQPAPIATGQNGITPYHQHVSDLLTKANTAPQTLTSQDQFRLNQVRGAEQKLTSDPDTRKQLLAVNEILNQYNTVDPQMFDQLTQFTGLAGRGRAALGFGEAAVGLPVSQAYQAYTTFQKQAKGMTDQLRKALGTSVRNQYVKSMLLPLVNVIDDTVGKNPQMARAQWQWLGNWLKSYRAAYTQAVEQGIPTWKIRSTDLIKQNPNLQQTAPGFVKAKDGKFYSVEQLQKLAGGGAK
jgi:hypothetical protein